MTITKLYRVTTTYLGAGEPTAHYFDTLPKAKKFLNNLDNGEIIKVKIISDYQLNYSDGCYYGELSYLTNKFKEIDYAYRIKA